MGRDRSFRWDQDGPAAGPRRQGGNSNPVRHRPGTHGRQQAYRSGKAGIQTGPAQRGNQGLQRGPERPSAHDQRRAGGHGSCPSGAALILGWRFGELLDFIPAYTATRGGLLSDCHLINESVAAAKVVDAGGRQLTAMAFEAEQYRQLQALGEPVGEQARITALGVAVQVHPRRARLRRLPRQPARPGRRPRSGTPPHYREQGWSWPPRLAAESFIAYGVFADPAQDRPRARLSGTVLKAGHHVCALTGQPFTVAAVRIAGFEADLCLAGSEHPGLPAPGNIISGTVVLSAAIDAPT